MLKRRCRLSTTHIILLSFLIAIAIGTLLLSLPISTQTGESVPIIDALFTATTSTCVTGLVTLPTSTTWSVFGQVVILILIQIGGLGVITTLFGVAIFMHKKMKLSDGLLIQDSLNINSMAEAFPFIKRIIKWTFCIEFIGAVLYCPIFIRDFGLYGIWASVFTSISAFCNAGIDVLGLNSLCDYSTNTMINCVTSFLIIMGGLGYVVWEDVLQLALSWRKGAAIKKRLSLHSKIVLLTTLVLIVGGGILILLFDYNNPNTIGAMTLLDKIKVSLFQSITCRTAGFATVPQENFTTSSSIVSMLLMFIGGSPVGTAGGVKTVTVVVVFLATFAIVCNKSDVEVFNRRIAQESINKAISVVVVSFSIMLLSTILLSSCTDAPFLHIIYETISASATVGVTMGLTPTLNLMGKIIIICTMYLGRVGPISLAIAFSANKEHKNIVKNPIEEINVG